MKSITVTTHRAINYGGVLQAYALQQFLLSHDIENQLLHLPRVSSFYRKLNTKSLRGLLFSVYCNINTMLHCKDAREIEKKFAMFIDEYLKVTKLNML